MSDSGAPRLARCEGEDFETGAPCPGTLAFRPEDGDAACDTCGGRCGSLVASYIDDAGPWPQAAARFARAVAEAWHTDHDAGHPRGRGNCPLCPPLTRADLALRA